MIIVLTRKYFLPALSVITLFLFTTCCTPSKLNTPGAIPESLTYSPDQTPPGEPNLYATNEAPASSPTAVSSASGIDNRFPRCHYPSDAVMTPDGNRVYVPCYSSSNIMIIDPLLNQVINTIDLSSLQTFGMHVIDAAISPDGSKIYLGDDMADVIAVVDVSTNTISGVIDFGMEGTINIIQFNPNGRSAWVAFEGGPSVGIIDTETQTVSNYFTATEEENFYQTVLSPDGKTAYVVSSMHGGRIYSVDTNSLQLKGRIDLGVEGILHPHSGIAISPDGNKLYLTSGYNEGGTPHPEIGTNRLFIIDLVNLKLEDQIEILGGPVRITLSPDGERAYVSTYLKLLAVDLDQRVILGEFDWGELYTTGAKSYKRGDLRTVVILPDQVHGYIAGWDGDILANLDLLEFKFTGAIELSPMIGSEPVDILISPDGEKAYVITRDRYPPDYEPAVEVFDLKTNLRIKRVILNGEPMRSTLSQDGSLLYIPSGDGFVTVFDTKIDEIRRVFTPEATTNYYTDAALIESLNKLYLSYFNPDRSGGILAVDLASDQAIGNIHVDSQVSSLALTMDGLRLFANRPLHPEGLLVIDTQTDEIIDNIPPPEGTNYPEVGIYTNIVEVSPDGLNLFWGSGPSYIHILNLDNNQITRTIDIFTEALTGLPVAPSGIDFSQDGSLAYISCLDAGFLVIWNVNLDQATGVVRTGLNPSAVAATPDDKYIYVTNMQSEDVAVVDMNSLKVVHTLYLGE